MSAENITASAVGATRPSPAVVEESPDERYRHLGSTVRLRTALTCGVT